MKKSLLSLLCVALLLAVPACKKEGSKGGMKKEKSGKMHNHDKKSKKMKAGKKKAHKGAKKAGAEVVGEAAHQ